jgi:hypothetical protein
MVLAFKPQFKEQVLTGAKTHTIREGNRWKPGHKIHMATGVRTKKYCQFNLGREDLDTCKSTQSITITWDDHLNELQRDATTIKVSVDGKQLNPKEVLTLAINDGFNSTADFVIWFKGGLQNGQIVHWTELRY